MGHIFSRLFTRIWLRFNPLLLTIGMLLIVSGLLHLMVWLCSETAWSGQVSWRKPTLFGVSGGLTLVSFAWLVPRLPVRRRDGLIVSLLSYSMLFEVALITLQQWRGVPSHFNHSSSFDVLVDTSMTLAILSVTVCLIDLGGRVFGEWRQPEDVRLAWRSGIAFLLLSCLIGFVILNYGAYRVSLGLDPTLYGQSGVVKFPHGMTIHAVQFLPLMVWGLKRVGMPIKLRVGAARSATYCMALLLTMSVHQTLTGRSRTDLSVLSICLIIMAVASWLPVVKEFLVWLRPRFVEGYPK